MRAHSSASTFNAPQVNTDELEEGAVDAPLMKDWLDIIDNCIALRALLRVLRSRGLAELFGALPHLCLARAADDDVERDVEVVEELDRAREHACVGLRALAARLGGGFGVGGVLGVVLLDDRVQKHLERVREEDEVLIVLCEGNRFPQLIALQVMA